MSFSLKDPSLTIYTNLDADNKGGYGVEKCSTFDHDLGCYVDDTYNLYLKGECCFIKPGS